MSTQPRHATGPQQGGFFGHPRGLARMRAKVGCNWTALPGIEYCLQDVTRLCLVTPLLLALDEVVAGDPGSRTMATLWEQYAAHRNLGLVFVPY